MSESQRLFRIRFTFKDGAWRVVSCKPSNQFAVIPVQNIERKGPGRYFLPVLSDREPHEFMAMEVTPKLCIECYLRTVPTYEKDLRQMQYLQRLAAESEPRAGEAA